MAAGIRVSLADDQRVVREGLGTLLGLLDGIELVGTAADGEEALALAAEHNPDVVLMDLRMPRMDGTEAIRRLAQAARPRRSPSPPTPTTPPCSARCGPAPAATRPGRRRRRSRRRWKPWPAGRRRWTRRSSITSSRPSERRRDGPAPRRADAPRGRGPRPDRRGPHQRGDRRSAWWSRPHGQEPRQPPVRQDRRARPRAGRRVRIRERPGADRGGGFRHGTRHRCIGRRKRNSARPRPRRRSRRPRT